MKLQQLRTSTIFHRACEYLHPSPFTLHTVVKRKFQRRCACRRISISRRELQVSLSRWHRCSAPTTISDEDCNENSSTWRLILGDRYSVSRTIKFPNFLDHGSVLSLNIGNFTSSKVELVEHDLLALRESCLAEFSQVNLDLSRDDATRHGTGGNVVSLSRKLRCFARVLFHSLGDLYATLHASTTRECV